MGTVSGAVKRHQTEERWRMKTVSKEFYLVPCAAWISQDEEDFKPGRRWSQFLVHPASVVFNISATLLNQLFRFCNYPLLSSSVHQIPVFVTMRNTVQQSSVLSQSCSSLGVFQTAHLLSMGPGYRLSFYYKDLGLGLHCLKQVCSGQGVCLGTGSLCLHCQQNAEMATFL